ncbi:hydroxyacid dehydrogenase [Thermoplasmatales archaeon AK]|nr:hydroxyacid dehydrogenase [Thermoplasmatales archaeon AK]
MESSLIEELKSKAVVIRFNPFSSEDELIKILSSCDIIVNRKSKLTGKIIRFLPHLKMIARTGAGVDETRIDLHAAKNRNILITYNPGMNSKAVAELTVMHALVLFRKFKTVSEKIKEKKWNEAQSQIGFELNGKKWGIIGFGSVGRNVARITSGFGCHIHVYDPLVEPGQISGLGYSPMEINELLASSDVVSIHVPLMPSTYHLIGKGQLSLMKRTAIIINTSRGGIIDESALYEFLDSGKIYGAGLDCLENEPMKNDEPLASLNNVIITPHYGGTTYESYRNGADGALTEVLRFIEGLQPLHKFLY